MRVNLFNHSSEKPDWGTINEILRYLSGSDKANNLVLIYKKVPRGTRTSGELVDYVEQECRDSDHVVLYLDANHWMVRCPNE